METLLSTEVGSRLGATLLGLALLVAASDAAAKDVPKPPINLPFDLQAIDPECSFEVNVVEVRNYSLGVSFYLKPPSRNFHLFEKEIGPQESKRISEILGAGVKPGTGKWVDSGVPAAFQIQIIHIESGIVLSSESIERPETGATFNGRYAELKKISLPVGTYSIRVRYLAGTPEVTRLHARVGLARSHHGK